VRLINDPEHFVVYYNKSRQALEHFRFPQIFFRQTKKAYISFVSPDMIESVTSDRFVPSYNAIRLACQRRGLKMDMRFATKIYASWLHQCGISSEEIDFLQGRTSMSIFSRHYLTPDSGLKDRVLDAVTRLKKAIEE
jgi:intergrase/recombinase